MDVASRIRRQREFLEFLIEKLQNPDEYQGRCYFCDKLIDIKSFNVPLSGQDPLTIHHVDETGTEVTPNEHINNRVIIHRDCHQQMHKLATKLGMPTALIREMVAKERAQKEASVPHPEKVA